MTSFISRLHRFHFHPRQSFSFKMLTLRRRKRARSSPAAIVVPVTMLPNKSPFRSSQGQRSAGVAWRGPCRGARVLVDRRSLNGSSHISHFHHCLFPSELRPACKTPPEPEGPELLRSLATLTVWEMERLRQFSGNTEIIKGSRSRPAPE